MRERGPQVVVIGGGITGLACAQRLDRLGVEAVVLEATGRPGGVIETQVRGGIQFEAGPNTLLANQPALLDLIDEVALGGEVVTASPLARRRWVWMGGRLHPVPRGPLSALTSPLVGVRGLAGVARDLAGRRAGRAPGDESVASFVRRRLGGRILDRLVSPFMAGVYAGDVEELEAASVLPALVEAERRGGSVIRGVLAARRASRRAGKPPLPASSITFRGGLESLPRRVAERLGARVRLNARVESISEESGGCRVLLSGGEEIGCEHVIVATGARGAGALIAGMSESAEVSRALRHQPAADLAVVGVAVDRGDVGRPLDGFGYLRGAGPTGPVLGCIFRSTIFPHTAPEGTALLVVFLGGMLHPGVISMDDRTLASMVEEELARTVGLRGAPKEVFIRRWSGAIPQYNRGHARTRAMVERWSARRRVSIIGSALTGVSVTACVSEGRAEAGRVRGVLAGAGRAPGTESCAPS